MNVLDRMASYERPWVGRVGLALILALWLLVTAVGFGVSLGVGLAFLIVGGALIAGEVWIDRSAGRHPMFAIVWLLACRIGLGGWLLVTAIARSGSSGWGAVLFAAFGVWLIVWGLIIATFMWREMRGAGIDIDV